MYDIESLENQWRRYRLKRLMLSIAAPVLVISAIAIFSYFWYLSQKDKNKTAGTLGEKNIARDMTHQTEQGSAKQTKTDKTSQKKGGMVITFADSQKSGSVSEKSSTAKHIEIKVSPKKSQMSVEGIRNRFESTRDKEDALFLSRYYYDKKQYKKALKWALEANKLDSDLEESWLIFGKAKAKTGNRKEAINVLQSYFDRTNSRKAKELLDKIRRGSSF